MGIEDASQADVQVMIELFCEFVTKKVNLPAGDRSDLVRCTVSVTGTDAYRTLATLIRRTASCWCVVVFSIFACASSTAWAVGLPIKTCSNGRTAYICKGDILVADPNAAPNNLGRIVLVDPVSGSQTIVAEGNP